MKYLTLLIAASLAAVSHLHAAESFDQIHEKPYVQVNTAVGTVRLSVYAPGAVRTQVFEGEEPEQRWNPAVVALPLPSGFNFTDGEKEAVLKTQKMRVVVDKIGGQISFYDAAGKLLTQTPVSGGLIGGIGGTKGVSQQFLVSPGEHLYGVGSSTCGLPYLNNAAFTLAQNNMEDAGHMLMSDRGYGMFWNNPSSGQFDSFGKQELLNDKYVRTEDGKPGFAAQYFPADSTSKHTHRDKYLQGKVTATIDITNSVSAVDIMRSDFDMAGTGKKGGGEDGLSLLCHGTLHTPQRTGWYYFNFANAGTGVRFVIDGDRVIERRIPHGLSWDCGRKWLEGGKDYPFEIYFSGAGKPVLQCYWDPTGEPSKEYTWKSSFWKTSDYFVFAGTKTDEILNGFYTVTGKPSILPKWSLAYIHCQALPFSSQKVDGFKRSDYEQMVQNYRQKKIPCDMIVQDFNWWTVMGSHIFRPDCYPEPFEDRLKMVHDAGFKFMISVWPIFQDNPAEGYKEKLTADDFKNRDELQKKGLLMNGWVDLVKPEAREIFWRQIADSLYNNKICVDAFWLDADEGGAKDGRYGNAYPLLVAMAVDEGARATFPNKRLFLLGRSMYPGIQRYDSALWSGDIGNDFWQLQQQVSAGLAVSACGMPYWTTDVGGFGGGFMRDTDYANDKEPNDLTYREVVARWFQYGMFCPIFRVHRADNNSAPWFYGEQVEKIVTDTIKFRYRLMPYIYSLTKPTRESGINPMRPLFMDFASDTNTVDVSQEFMYGPAFLVCPVTQALYHPYDPKKGKAPAVASLPEVVKDIQVYLPKGADWYDFRTGEKYPGGQSIQSPAPLDWMPLFVKAGSIVPMGKVIESTSLNQQTEMELRIYPGADADFVLYDDDGVSYDYEKNGFSEIPIHWDDAAGKLTIGARRGQFATMPKELVFKPVLVTKGNGVGSLAEYAGAGNITYTGKEAVWLK